MLEKISKPFGEYLELEGTEDGQYAKSENGLLTFYISYPKGFQPLANGRYKSDMFELIYPAATTYSRDNVEQNISTRRYFKLKDQSNPSL